MSDWSEEEYEREAERLGWTVEYLKGHIQKEERLVENFKILQKEIKKKENKSE